MAARHRSAVKPDPVRAARKSELSSTFDRTAPGERIWFRDRVGFFENERWLGDRGGPEKQLDLPEGRSAASFYGNRFALKTRTPWTMGGVTYAPDTLLGGSLLGLSQDAPALEVLFEGGRRTSLQAFFWLRGILHVSILDNLKPRFEVHTPLEAGWARAPLDGLPDASIVSVWPLDAEDAELNGELLVSYQDPLTPPTLALMTEAGAPAVLKRAPAAFAADGLTVTRHEAISSDGERIPYTQVGPAVKTGDAPVLTRGYGGFGIE